MTNPEFFKNKVVVITGSSKGIGKAIAVELGMSGAKIVLNGRNLQALQLAENEFKSNNIDAFSVAVDVSEIEGAEKLILETISHFGRIDALINNAGIAVRGLFLETEPQKFEEVFRSNTLSYIYPTRFALPFLIQTKGSIIFISSIGGRGGLPGHCLYSLSKMPLNSLAQTLDIELQQYGIHVGIVYLGFIRNETDKKIMDGSGKYQKLESRSEMLLTDPGKVAKKIKNILLKRKRSKVISFIGHLQSVFYLFPPMRRLIMTNMLKKYYTMYRE